MHVPWYWLHINFRYGWLCSCGFTHRSGGDWSAGCQCWWQLWRWVCCWRRWCSRNWRDDRFCGSSVKIHFRLENWLPACAKIRQMATLFKRNWKKVNDREHNLVIQGIYIDSHKIGQFELDNPPSLKAISWTARAFLWSKKGQGKQVYWATPTKVLLYFSVIYYMNTILVIIRIDQVRIFSIKFVIILKIIQNSRWVPWIWFDFSFCTLLAGSNN